MKKILTTTNHDRESAGLNYIYPVISRRAGGLSIGVNFNINNACNWRCVYCQVPNLIKGSAPDLDFKLLEDELRLFLNDVLEGGFFEDFQVSLENRVIKDIAISGNGEPTSIKDFPSAISLIGTIASEFNIFPDSRFVLITNGSLVHHRKVQAGLEVLNSFGGEVWFKFDSATKEGKSVFNGTIQSVKRSLENIRIASGLCPTKLQTCLFYHAGYGHFEQEKHAYLQALEIVKETTDVKDVLLYTLARPSLQPEARFLTALPLSDMDEFAEAIRSLGFGVTVSC